MQCLFILRIYIFMYYNRCEQNVFVFIFWFVFFFSSFFLGGWGISDHGAPVCSNRFSPGSLLLPVAHRWASYVRCCNWKCRVSFTEFIIHPHANNLSQELDRISIKLFHCQIKSSANSQLCWGKYLRFLSLFHPLFRIFFLVVFFLYFCICKKCRLVSAHCWSKYFEHTRSHLESERQWVSAILWNNARIPTYILRHTNTYNLCIVCLLVCDRTSVIRHTIFNGMANTCLYTKYTYRNVRFAIKIQEYWTSVET